MKILTTLVCVPLLAAVSVIPAQVKKAQTEAQPVGLATDTKATKADAAIKEIDAFIARQAVNKAKPGWKQTLSKPPQLTFDPDHEYFWHMETAVGTLKIRYYTDTAPMHVSSGIYLSRLGFYDGLNFHRIIPNFMAQGGCPAGTGSGRPGYVMAGEFKGGRRHNKGGLLSTANAGPRTDGSQFFLTFVPYPSLDGKYTLWGEVVDGQKTLKELAKLGTRANNGMLRNGPKIVRTWVEVVAKPKPKKEEGHEKEGKGEHGKKKEGRGEHGGGGR